MLTKIAKICILAFVIAPAVFGSLGNDDVAATTSATLAEAMERTTAAAAAISLEATPTNKGNITNDLQATAPNLNEMKQNRQQAAVATKMADVKILPELQHSTTMSATTSTATPTTTATTSTTTTTAASLVTADGNEAGRQISNAKTTAAAIPTPTPTPPAAAATTTILTSTTTRATATSANKLMMPAMTTNSSPATLSNIKDALQRIKLTEAVIGDATATATTITTEIPTPIGADESVDTSADSSGAADAGDGALHIQMQAAASYQVAETLADLNEEERARYRSLLAQQPTASKLNIVDLYPLKLEDFQPIIRDSNEQLLRQRTVFTQPDNAAEYRQNLMPNEVDMLPPKLTVNQVTTVMTTAKPAPATTAAAITTATPTGAGIATTVSDFTGKLLAEQDDLITEIERKFQLQETTAATPTTRKMAMPAVRYTSRRPLPQLAAGDRYIDRRVKKSFEFPLHRASDVMGLPHVDFANTKFNTDTIDGDAKPPMGDAAAHPEFSTTKFYNSKELYNEMLLHNKRKLMKTVTTTAAAAAAESLSFAVPTAGSIIKSSAEATAATAATGATATGAATVDAVMSTSYSLEELSKTSGKSSQQQQQHQLIRTSDPTKLGTSTTKMSMAATTASSTTTAVPRTTTAWRPAVPATLASTAMPTGAADTLRRVTLMPATQSFPDTETMEMSTSSPSDISTTTRATTSPKPKKYQKELKRAKLLVKTLLPAATRMPNTDLDNLEVVAANGDKAEITTKTATVAAPMAVTASIGYASLPVPRGYAANPPKSASKPIARPRILSRLQEKINSLECEMQNVPQDSHLWRGNETHELLLPIVTTEHCKVNEKCIPNVLSWRGESEIQSSDILIVEISDAMLNPTHEQNNTSSAAHAIQVYQVTRSGHEHCDVTEGVLLDITPLMVDGRKLVTLYDKDLTEGVNLLIVVSELWGSQCVRLKVTTKTDNCGESADCSGKGVCYSNAAMEEYECQCCSGFAGPHCEEIDACNPSPCTNNGICVDLSQGHEGNSYQCLCPYGYAGKNCQYESDPCNPAECMNGGSCVGNSTHFRCDCTPGFTGALCQHSLNECESSPCVHGICVDQEDGFRCFCQPGFAGELCNFEYNECESNPCQNGGECIDHIGSFECRCTKGYTGNRCQIKVDFCANKPCPEGHRCIDHGNDFSCECPGGRNGPDCNQMPRTYLQQCSVNPCTHGGTCWSSGESFYCACRPGYTGTMCEDEFVVETVVSSSEFIVDDANARNFNDKTFGSSVVLKSPIELHNAYFAAGVLAAAIFIVAVVVTICHCKVNQTYRKFSTRTSSFIPILGFSRRPKLQGKLNKHWLSGKGLGVAAAAAAAAGVQRAAHGSAQSTRHLPCQPAGSSSNSQTQTTLGGQLHERPFQRHLAMNLENDMYYTVDFSENSQHSPLIQ